MGPGCFERLEPGSLGWTDKNNPFIPVIRVLPSYTFDRNGNLLTVSVMTNTFDAANRLVSSNRSTATVQPVYNGVGDRVGQTVGATTGTTTNFENNEGECQVFGSSLNRH